MKKKLIITLTMSGLLLLGNFSSVLAASQPTTDTKIQVSPSIGNDDPTKGDISVTANVESRYQVEIPAEINFGTIKKGVPSDPIELKMKLMEKDSLDHVKVLVGKNDYSLHRKNNLDPNLDDPENVTIPFSLRSVYAFENGAKPGEGAEVFSLDTKGSDVLLYNVNVDTNNITKGGDYKGTLQFQFVGE